jgi:signal transduction histidine kinase
MINACVSHDLRNPLNSIKAINIEKKFIYKMLEDAISNEEVTVQELVKHLRTLLNKLKDNLKT